MVELDTMLSLLQTASIVIGVFYYIMTLQNSNRTQQLTLKAQKQQLETRQATLFSQYHLHYQSKEFQKDINNILYTWEWKNYEDFRNKYGSESETLDSFSSWIRIFQYYDGLGVLVRKGLLDTTIVADMMSVTLLLLWEKNKTTIFEAREYNNQPQAFGETEYLVKVIKKLTAPKP